MNRLHGSESRQNFRPFAAPQTSPKRLTSFATVSFATLGFIAVLLSGASAIASDPSGHSIGGRVVDSSGTGMEGVMVSAIDEQHRKWISVFTQKDGSFSISELRNIDHSIRTRLMGLADQWFSGVAAGTEDMVIQTRPAIGEELELQRPANSAFSMLSFDHPHDKLNFKMMCAYCHQIGTVGFRTPEEPSCHQCG